MSPRTRSSRRPVVHRIVTAQPRSQLPDIEFCVVYGPPLPPRPQPQVRRLRILPELQAELDSMYARIRERQENDDQAQSDH